MDLRDPISANRTHLDEGVKLIQRGELWYQPFILANGIEVGEGQNLADNYRNCQSLLDWNVYLSPEYHHLWKDNPRKLAEDHSYFSACNHKYRLAYDRIADAIADRLDMRSLSVLEIGCNTGLNLFNLAARGAKSCTGVDWTDHGRVFRWLNRVLKTKVIFVKGSYDNLRHTIPGSALKADLVINTVFINHQSDPIQFLCYLADRAEKALFLWVLLNDSDDLTIRFGRVEGLHDLGATRRLPLSFHNDVTISRPLFMECLRRLGFEHVDFIEQPTDWPSSPPSGLAPFAMVYAARTKNIRSAFSKGRPAKSFWLRRQR